MLSMFECMKNRRAIRFGVVLLFLCFFIRSSNSQLLSDDDIATKSSFSIEELTEDYNQFWNVLRENYPYYDYISQYYDLDEIMAEGLAKINSDSDVNDLYEVLSTCCRELHNSAHLSVIDNDLYNYYLQMMSDNNNEQITPWLQAVSRPQSTLTYTELLNGHSEESAYDSIPQVDCDYYTAGSIAYFKYYSFLTDDRDQNVITNYLDDLISSGSDVENIVIDITANSGGNTLYWARNIVEPLGGSYSCSWNYYISDSPMMKSYFLDNTYFDFVPLPTDEKTELKNQTSLEMIYKTENKIDFDGAINQYSGIRRWVLIGNETYSSADEFAVFCKKSGWATLVGKMTRGDGMGTTPVIASLDNTGLLFRFSATFGLNDDYSLNAFTGTRPDYAQKRTETALSACMRIINGKR